MKGDEELLEAFSGIEGLLKQITSDIAKVEGEIDENETFRISFSFNVKDETYIISDLRAYKEILYD